MISLQSKGPSKSLAQHHNSKASVLWCSALFMVQVSHLFRTNQSYGFSSSHIYCLSPHYSLVAQMVKRLPATWETQVRSLGQEDPLEKEMATHSNTLAWKIPWTEEPGELHTVHGVAKSQTGLHFHFPIYKCARTEGFICLIPCCITGT